MSVPTDADGFPEAVREECATELDRLGSEKALIATTAARLERERVLETALAAELRAAETFEGWAADETDDRARALFERVAATERAHADRVRELGDLEAPDTEPEPDALHGRLRGLEGSVERVAAGAVARPLVASRSLLQVVNFFVNEADNAAAGTFRELRTETDELPPEGAALLGELCTDASDWERALTAATDAVTAAYREYADTLEGMGVDPKPVC
jgi:hypothetical protein